MRDAVSPAYYIVYLCKFILYVAEHTIRVALTQLAPSAFYVKFCHRQFGIGTRPCSTTYYVIEFLSCSIEGRGKDLIENLAQEYNDFKFERAAVSTSSFTSYLHCIQSFLPVSPTGF